MGRSLRAAWWCLLLFACVGDDPIEVPPKGALGAPCDSADACASGICGDGVCCDRRCDGQCEACNAAGQCAPVTGKPKHAPCGGDESGVCAGSCDGIKVDACTFPEVECGPASCAANVATLPSTCKAGTCPGSTTQTCTMGCYQDTCLGVTQVAAGYYFACARLTDAKVRCWGSNASGVIAQNATDATASYPTPKEIPNLVGVRQIAATFGTACVLMDDQTVRCWGSNVGGALGAGTDDTNPHRVPAAVPGLSNVVSLHGGSGGFCAIVTGGQIRCWGSTSTGELGNGVMTTGAVGPVTVCAPGSTSTACTPATGAVSVIRGDGHGCALFGDGRLACWGSNGRGELGRSGGADPFPKYVDGLASVSMVTAGNGQTCVAAGGGAKCWGSNGFESLGIGKTFAQLASTPTPTSVCATQDCTTLLMGVTAISTYDEAACAIANGAVKCWGDNSGGQLGDGNITAKQNFAGSTAIPANAVQVLSAGESQYAVIVDRAVRDVRCWGDDGSAQCGDAPPPSTTHKTPVAPKW